MVNVTGDGFPGNMAWRVIGLANAQTREILLAEVASVLAFARHAGERWKWCVQWFGINQAG